MLHNASGRRELKPNQRVWKGIASHFEKVERKRRIWQGSIVVSFALISTFSAIYFSIPNTPIAATLPQLNGKEIIEQHGSFNNEAARNAQVIPFKALYNAGHKQFQISNISDTKLYLRADVDLLLPIKQFNKQQLNSVQNFIESVKPYYAFKKPLKKTLKNNLQVGFTVGYSNNIPFIPNTGTTNSDITLLPLQTIQVGGNIAYKITPKCALSTGINIYKTGAAYYLSGSKTFIAQEKSMVNIYSNSFWVAEIPVTINYIQSIKKNWGINVGAGIAVQCKLPSRNNDGAGYHIAHYGRNVNGLAIVNAKVTKETKNLIIAFGPTVKYQMLTTNHSGNYKLFQKGAELSIGFKL
ncbi:MAG: hypothetical protein SGJ10_04645 [Bacteroidota bacterium]|nr:hypothetical protein [Bacteroidota bacterium]